MKRRFLAVFSRFFCRTRWAPLWSLTFVGGIAALLTLRADGPLSLPSAGGAEPVSDASSQPTNSTQAENNASPGDKAGGNAASGNESEPNSMGLGSTENPESPILPGQGLNASPLYASPIENGGVASVLSAPALYNTGAFDLSQVSANNVLQAAFLGMGAFPSLQPSDLTPSPLDRVELGPINLKAALNLSFISDDNIDAQPAGPHRTSDTEIAMTPAVLLSYGTREGQRGTASIVYAPTLTRFLQNSSQNSDDQNVSVNLQYPLQRLTLSATETYAQTTGVNLDARARVTQSTDIATGGGTYDVDNKLSVESHFEYLDTEYTAPGGGTGSLNGQFVSETRETWSSVANYAITPKLTIGPGLNLGFETPENSPQQTFEQGLFNFNYRPSEKIALFGQAGAEFRQYERGKDELNPVFSAGVNYTPTERATLTLTGYRTVVPSSDDSDQTDINTGASLTAKELLFQRVLLSFSFFYVHTQYSSNGESVALPGNNTGADEIAINGNNSQQDNFVYRPSITFATSQRSTLALYYQYLANASSTANVSYHDNQFGISISAQF